MVKATRLVSSAGYLPVSPSMAPSDTLRLQLVPAMLCIDLCNPSSSQKVLGKLYRAIDESDFFTGIQRQSRAALQPQSLSLAERVWEYVREKTALMQYQHYLDFARDVKEA